MKKFNGTDYDGLLPLAYNALNSDNSALLGGKSFEDIQQYVQSENKLIRIGNTIISASANAAMSFNLQRIDMTKIEALILTFAISSSNGAADIYVNDKSLGQLCYNNWSTTTGICYIIRGYVQYFTNCVESGDGFSTNQQGGGANIAWNDIRSVTVNGNSQARSVLKLFGLLL